jgi:two-component system, OmpR family, sensor kinase
LAKARLSLSTLIFASHLALTGLTILVFAILASVQAYRGVYERAESELLGAAELLEQQLASGTHVEQLQIPDVYFHRFGKAPRDQAYWAYWDRDRQLVGSGGAIDSHLEPSKKQPPQNGPRPFVTRAEGRQLELFVQTPDDGQLVVGRPLAKEFDGLGHFALRLLGLVLAGILIAAATAFWITRWIVRPITDFASTVETITHRKLDSRLTLAQPTREMSRLAISFNSMLEAIQQSFQQQQRFTSDAAHELRTPVAIMLSQSEYSLLRDRSADEYRQGFETCRRISVHMKQLVEDLMDSSRIDAGQLPISISELDMQELVTDVIRLFEPIAKKRGVVLKSECQSCSAIGDRKRVLQILLNLTANAIEYSHPGGTVTLSLVAETDTVCLKVVDQGQGIPADELTHVWNRFYRVDCARTQRDDTGTGLGLSLVADLVKLLGGTYGLESAVGQGTTVTIRLPKPENCPRMERDLGQLESPDQSE